MTKTAAGTALLVVGAAVLALFLPDIRRYLHMRRL
ncbi:DUF6893 family small protein [Streptomyces sp. NPDC086023]